ncbi:MAG: CDP-diacylglycerol--serine O-phosphatidyltransferase [Alphaproteobacteria bacterium]
MSKPRSELHLAQLLPNLLTIAAMCAGLTGIRFAIFGQYQAAVGMILVAAVLDGLDGRVARLLRSESEIGAELDSLVDFVNFGVAPGLIIYMWGLHGLQSGGWIATLIYASCCLLRLARFNIGNRPNLEGEPGDKPVSSDFTGVPSPAGAMLALLPTYVAFISPDIPQLPSQLLALYMVLIGALMISQFPTPSFKSVTFYAENARYVIVGFVALVAALLTFPWETMLVITLSYVGVLIVALWRARKIRLPKGRD